jgi:serine/threonine-protein kinase
MVGQNIGKYRVLERIGRGGMGTVYRAIDETLHRDVAIKVLNAELNDPEVAKRFRAEAITVARLSHPGIATIYELFQSDGQWLMVMEFLRGETLEHMVERMGPLSPQRTAEIGMQTLAALAHAHAMGVVHRDLKPANIMMTETGAIKIMDFGIARVAGTEHLTSAGFMMGTPAYMAPEQVMGHEIDARADLYAMGVVFYRLTTAKLPFKGDTPFAMAQSQVNDPPTPIGMVRSDLPPWVGEVTTRALAKNPDERFQSAADFHESLARCLSGLPLLPLGHNAAAETQLLMTPPRAMPTGSIRSALPPLTGATPPPSGSQPIVTPAPNVAPASPVVSAPLSGSFDASAPTMLSPSPSGAVPVAGPPSGPVIAQASTSAAIPLSPASTVSGAPTSPVPVQESSVPSAAPLASSTTASVATSPATSTAAVSTAAVPSPAAPAAASTSNATAAVPGKKGSAGILAIVAAVIVLAGGAAYWFKSRPTSEPAPAQTAAAETPAPAPAADAPASAPSTEPAAPAADAAAMPARESTAASAPRASGPARSSAPAAAARGTSAPASTPEPEPAIDDTPKSFPQTRILLVKGRKGDDQEVTLWFSSGYVNAIAKKGQESIGALPYKSITSATYVRARDPKWNPDLASPPANLDVGGMLRTDKNWLVLQGADAYLVLRLDDSNARAVLQTLTERTRVTVTYAKN